MAFLLKNSKKIYSYIKKQLIQNPFIIGGQGVSTRFKSKETFFIKKDNIRGSKTQTQSEVDLKQGLYVDKQSYGLAVGDKLNGFVVKQVEKVPELNLIAVKLLHEATQAEYFHVDRKDSNNAFSVIFKTTPTDSTGLPHILEHTTLCGSIRYPCRDPFFKMLNRSLASFMNALTASDWTMYPFLTTNSKDYKNLMSVYLDAVFHPLLKESDFNQEGWHLEYSDPKDINSPIIIKGVVFNEMKGVFSDNNNIFAEALQRNILPSHTYSVCSGGDPVEIPNLKYDDLKNFHNNYYSPFNAKYYSYGNIPLIEHLEFINEKYLKDINVTKGKLSTDVPPEKRWTEPVYKKIKCGVNPLAADKNKQSSIAISHLCCSITDIEECFILKILSELLVSGPNSSFYKTLIEPNIGSGFSPVTGFEGDTRDTYFTIGLQEVSENDFERIIEIFETTIDDVIENGFDPKHLETIIHSIELNTKHQTSNFGLSLLFHVVSTWNHGGDIIESLKTENKIKNLRQKIADNPKFLQNKVNQYLKENKHRLVLCMSPDENYVAERKKLEDDLLNRKLKDLTEENKRRIYEYGLKALEQHSEDDKSCLPTLSINDLNRDIEIVPFLDVKVSHTPFRLFPQPTNGVTYFRGLINVKDFTEEELALLPLFALISTKMGTKKHNFKDFHQLVSLKTGGLFIGNHFIHDTKSLNRIEENLTISSYCLNKNLEDMFHLWLELLQEMELSDVNRFETLVKAEAADLANGIVRMGHRYAMLSSASLISPVGNLKEKRGGLSYVNLMKEMVQSSPEKLLEKMRDIRKSLQSANEMRFSSNVQIGTEDDVIKKSAILLKNISSTPGFPGNFQELMTSSEDCDGVFHVLPIQVNFASKALNAVPYEHEDFAPLRVLTRLLTMKFLHPEIREKAGAYGCGLNLSQSGLLTFYSYSDPNPSNSLLTFDRSLSWLLEKKFTQEDVDEAKLGIFQNIDAPIPPGDKGMRQFLFGVSDEAYYRHRLQLMKVTIRELIDVGVKYLDEIKSKRPVGRAVIGKEDKKILESNSVKWKIYSSE